MVCVTCQTKDIAGKDCAVCWCGIDLCSECVEAHIDTCEWAKAMRYKPAKKKKKKEPLPRIGQQSRHYSRRAETA